MRESWSRREVVDNGSWKCLEGGREVTDRGGDKLSMGLTLYNPRGACVAHEAVERGRSVPRDVEGNDPRSDGQVETMQPYAAAGEDERKCGFGWRGWWRQPLLPPWERAAHSVRADRQSPPALVPILGRAIVAKMLELAGSVSL